MRIQQLLLIDKEFHKAWYFHMLPSILGTGTAYHEFEWLVFWELTPSPWDSRNSVGGPTYLRERPVLGTTNRSRNRSIARCVVDKGAASSLSGHRPRYRLGRVLPPETVALQQVSPNPASSTVGRSCELLNHVPKTARVKI